MENKPIDLNAFRENAAAQEGNLKKKFQKLRKVKPKALDKAFHELHEEVFSEINCLSCANCCKTTGPLFTDADINRLARYFKMKPASFIDTYLKVDEDGDFVLQSTPCPFLGADNYCSVYEVRPKACAQYPHTDKNGMHQILGLTRKNALMCPAVFEIVQRIEKKL